MERLSLALVLLAMGCRTPAASASAGACPGSPDSCLGANPVCTVDRARQCVVCLCEPGWLGPAQPAGAAPVRPETPRDPQPPPLR
ncbi:MAG TPA: hypothetical protein VFG59_20010 [Anaeromyxobacter sp.]|nr:hypothetical protein [Anaeromyxobacter sp.]